MRPRSSTELTTESIARAHCGRRPLLYDDTTTSGSAVVVAKQPTETLTASDLPHLADVAVDQLVVEALMVPLAVIGYCHPLDGTR